jgi:hypothetical protein
MMMPFYVAIRAAIIIWVTLSLIPVEAVFNAVEAEIDREQDQ